MNTPEIKQEGISIKDGGAGLKVDNRTQAAFPNRATRKKGKEIELKASVLNRWGLLIFSPFLWCILYFVFHEITINEEFKNKIWSMMALAGLFTLPFVILSFLKNLTIQNGKIRIVSYPIIHIGERGITFDHKETILWEKIEHAFIHERGKAFFFTIEYLDDEGNVEKKDCNISDYDFDNHDIEKAIVYWSGKDIASEEVNTRDEMLKWNEVEGIQTEEQEKDFKEKCRTYLPIFKKQYKRERAVFFTTFSLTFALFTFALLYVGYNNFDHYPLNLDSLYNNLFNTRPIIAFILMMTGLCSFLGLPSAFMLYFVRKRFLSRKDIADLSEVEVIAVLKIMGYDDKPNIYKKFLLVTSFIFIIDIAAHFYFLFILN